LREAVDHYRGCGRPLWLAAGAEDLAVAVARRYPDEAQALLAEAIQLYEACGARRDAERVGTRLRGAGVTRPRTRRRPQTGWASLSVAERDVVLLAAEGMTNRAIAERLYISPHTVTTHLKHVFIKLDVHSRVELTRVALQQQS
jgi:DNA-binding CsgD family transcriptional regulator